ncbi:MAG: hypothetical protein IPG50_29255 [Myxococcales bacterium]|nr:hypothetical protein [Myxococcales bacterium]
MSASLDFTCAATTTASSTTSCKPVDRCQPCDRMFVRLPGNTPACRIG